MKKILRLIALVVAAIAAATVIFWLALAAALTWWGVISPNFFVNAIVAFLGMIAAAVTALFVTGWFEERRALRYRHRQTKLKAG